MKNFLLIFLVVFVLQNTGAQIAKFEKRNVASDPEPDTFFCESVQLRFINLSEPAAGNDLTAYNFKWHFGKPLKSSVSKDTILSSAGEVRMRFDRPGWHYIQLVMFLDKDTVATYKDSIEIRPQPNAWFTVADTFKLGELKYRFISGKKPDKNIIYTYKWYFDGDSTIHSASKYGIRDSLIHTFSEGKHIMKLVVLDKKVPDEKCFDTYSESFRATRQLYFPTAFSPNGDGTNDFFKVQVNGRDIFQFFVYDSKGALKFKSESPTIIWDGYDLNGKEAPSGIYYFILESINTETPVKEVGYVMLMRQR